MFRFWDQVAYFQWSVTLNLWGTDLQKLNLPNKVQPCWLQLEEPSCLWGHWYLTADGKRAISETPATFNKKASALYKSLSSREKEELRNQAPEKKMTRKEVLYSGEKIFQKIQRMVSWSCQNGGTKNEHWYTSWDSWEQVETIYIQFGWKYNCLCNAHIITHSSIQFKLLNLKATPIPCCKSLRTPGLLFHMCRRL